MQLHRSVHDRQMELWTGQIVAMRKPLMLRIDFTLDGEGADLPGRLSKALEIRSLQPSSPALYEKISTLQPDVICCDYDCPDAEGLNRLRQIKKDFPSIPILMLTEHNSSELAIWALRSRVWDFFIKPLDADVFLQSVQQLHELRQGSTNRSEERKVVAPASTGNREAERRTAASTSPSTTERAMAKARTYIAHNYEKKILARDVASLVNMSPFQFSRCFRRDCGMTFSEYLLETRIRKAIEILSGPGATVTGACFDVGFTDLSYFGRIFKRYAGMTPSEYRERYLRSLDENDTEPALPEAQLETEDPLDESLSNLHMEVLQRLRRS